MNPEPPVGSSMPSKSFSSAYERGLRPDVSGQQVDPATAIDRVSLEHRCQLLEVDSQWLQAPRNTARSTARSSRAPRHYSRRSIELTPQQSVERWPDQLIDEAGGTWH